MMAKTDMDIFNEQMERPLFVLLHACRPGPVGGMSCQPMECTQIPNRTSWTQANQEYNIHFIATSDDCSPLEMADGVVDSIK
jgi:hypothetical protein